MKVLKITILSLFVLLVLSVLGNLIISAIGLFFNHNVLQLGSMLTENPSASVKLIFVVKAIALLVFVLGTFILLSKLNFLMKRDFFNNLLTRSFSKTGRLFLVAGIIGIIASVLEVVNMLVNKDFKSQIYLNIDSKSLYIMLMILGAFLLLFSKVLSKGNQIQQENDLTI